MNASILLLAILPAAPADGPPVVAVGVSADGRFLCVARGDNKTGEVCVWDLSKPALVAVVPDVGPGVHLVQPTADGKRFVLAAGEGRVDWFSIRVTRAEVWDVATKKRTHGFEVGPKEVAQIAVSPDGNWVAYDHTTGERNRPRVTVRNTDTGKVAEAVSKAATESPGAFAFTADSKRLAVARYDSYGELDLATGKKEAGWKRDPKATVKPEPLEDLGGAWVAPLPGGKGVLSVSATLKRRQSYIVRLMTEKKDWHLGEFWDYVSAATISPDGRWLALGSSGRDDESAVFLLRLDANGNPETEEKQAKGRPVLSGEGEAWPVWKEWAVGGAKRVRFAPVVAIAFSADGKRAFTGGPGGEVRAWDPATRETKATITASPAAKDGLPAWRITTASGDYVGTPPEPDPAKVRAALTGK